MHEKLQWKFWLLLCMMMWTSQRSYSQLSSCINADFEQGTFVNWTGTTGVCCPINSTTTGIVSGRHTIMTGSGTDPNTNGAVPVVAPGGQFSARLGNDNTGAQAEQLSYQISVDTTNALFIYRYAVVLEDPSHSPSAQPRFEIRVYDANGLPVGCGTYNVYASAGIPGFITIVNQSGGVIRYQNWTTVGLDLSAYIGQTITIEFSTGDCAHGGHFGYAYVDCYCSPLRILSDFCLGSGSTTLTAPLGFASYLWSTGDSTQTINLQNAIVGTQYQCTMTSVTGCTVTLTAILSTTVIASAYNLNNNCQNPVQFYDSSVVVTGSPINQWLWNFGDGTTSTLQNPLHTFSAVGSYSVSLLVTNAGGCTDTILQNVVIGPQPLPTFNATVVCPGTPTLFTDLSFSPSGSIAAWNWNFGDGSPVDSSSAPTHIYQLPGTYPVQLIITDSIGCKDTTIQTVATLPGPVSGFTVPVICAQNQVGFLDTSLVVGTSISGWEWSFGDASPLVSGTGAPVHTYLSPGNYTTELIVTTANGCIDTASSLVTVCPLPSVSFYADTVCFGDKHSFQNLTAIASGSVVSWNWSFGDNTLSNSFEPNHTYASIGTFPITLVATSNMGCKDSSSNTAHVWHLPRPDFMVNDSAGCRPHGVQFTNLSTSIDGSIIKCWWDFGNGDVDSLPVVEAKYIDAGKYDVNLKVRSNYGCQNDTTKYKYVTVYELPTASFINEPNDPSMFVPVVSFLDKSVNAIQWWWNFGDSTTSELQFPQHSFTQVGVYTITLIVESTEGCRDTTWEVLELKDDYAFWIPNSFTPNDDGTNDLFIVKGFGYSDFSIIVFNRLGDLIFSSTNDSVGWDGKQNGTPAAMDVYVYVVKIKDVFGSPHIYNGTLSLVR
ncbi:MAG: PKD domain-containing protein [Bacteroidetes bacterium]|nr:PKD domain-containing protein [Bacteroidota bacterium]